MPLGTINLDGSLDQVYPPAFVAAVAAIVAEILTDAPSPVARFHDIRSTMLE